MLLSQLQYITLVNCRQQSHTQHPLGGEHLGTEDGGKLRTQSELGNKQSSPTQRIIVRGIYHDDNKNNDGDAKLCCMAGIKQLDDVLTQKPTLQVSIRWCVGCWLKFDRA